MAILLGGVWLFNFNSPDSLALSVDGISPTSGSPSGGETVTITGTGFADLVLGTPLNYGYSGAVETYTTAANGVYQLEVWGAKGANYTNAGGAGGYSVGSVYLTAGTDLFVRVGGQGSGGAGGFNGGGSGNSGGGGASDIRIGTNNDDEGGLYARVIVAGGGGGGGSGTSGVGGGANGGNGYNPVSSCTGLGGSQIAGGTGSGGSCVYSSSGQFGKGGSYSFGNGGGGGWYGGTNNPAGSGGSGWVYTESTYNYWATSTGLGGQWLLNSDYYLINASTTAGNVSFPAPSGGTEVGHAGDGYARITPYVGQVPSVLFDTTPAVNCAVVSDTEMTCQTPAHATGTVPVTVDGVPTDDFEYLDPTFINLTTDKSELNMSGLPNVLIADYLTANVITNNPTGYSLSLTADEPDLTCLNDTSYKIIALDGTKAMTDNHWGYAIAGDSLTTPTIWTGVTNSLLPPAKTSPTATDLTDGDDTIVWFGTQANMSLPACQYAGNVVFTAVANENI